MQPLTWLQMPADAGQIVDVSYATLGERGVARRTIDQSLPSDHPRRETYEIAPWDDDVEEPFEPQNGRLGTDPAGFEPAVWQGDKLVLEQE